MKFVIKAACRKYFTKALFVTSFRRAKVIISCHKYEKKLMKIIYLFLSYLKTTLEKELSVDIIFTHSQN